MYEDDSLAVVAKGGLPNPLAMQQQAQYLAQATKEMNPRDRDTWLTMTVLPQLDQLADTPALRHELKERYQFIKKLGQGSGGEVELVMDLDILRLVALKRLRADHHQTKAMLNFINEIRIVGHLEHPNIVPIHDVGRDSNGCYYFVMKYTPGIMLSEIIDKLKAGHKKTHIDYPLAKRVAIFQEILHAVEFAHFHGIIHRDIKPSNVIVGNHGEVTLMDWGIAKYLKGKSERTVENKLLQKFEKDIHLFNSRLTDGEKIGEREGTVLGTFGYMAPEQAAGQNAEHDQRTDIYALCALLYELLTLETYIDLDGDVASMLKQIRTKKPKLPRTVRSPYQLSIPADYSHAIMKGLHKEKEKRYQSVAELRIILDRIQNGEAPVQCAYTLSKRMVNFVSHLLDQGPLVGLFFFLFLLGLAGVGLYSLFRWANWGF